MFDFLKEHYESLSIALIGLYLALEKLLSGSSRLKNSIISDQKIRIAQVIEERDRFSQEKQVAEKLVVARDATIIEKDKQIDEKNDQIAFRNPDLVKILSDTRDLLKGNFEMNQKVVEFMAMNIKMMNKINEKMDYQTNILEKGEKRSQKIDKATALHKGQVLRAPVKKRFKKK